MSDLRHDALPLKNLKDQNLQKLGINIDTLSDNLTDISKALCDWSKKPLENLNNEKNMSISQAHIIRTMYASVVPVTLYGRLTALLANVMKKHFEQDKPIYSLKAYPKAKCIVNADQIITESCKSNLNARLFKILNDQHNGPSDEKRIERLIEFLRSCRNKKDLFHSSMLRVLDDDHAKILIHRLTAVIEHPLPTPKYIYVVLMGAHLDNNQHLTFTALKHADLTGSNSDKSMPGKYNWQVQSGLSPQKLAIEASSDTDYQFTADEFNALYPQINGGLSIKFNDGVHNIMSKQFVNAMTNTSASIEYLLKTTHEQQIKFNLVFGMGVAFNNMIKHFDNFKFWIH